MARVEKRVLGKWELAETGDFSLEISGFTIKRTTPRRTYESTYSVSDEGYIITDEDIFVFEDCAFHRHYSTTEFYVISTYLRPAGTVISLSELP